MLGFLLPQKQLTESQVQAGLRPLLFDGVCSQIMGVLTGGAFLVALALLLDASNMVIGLLAAIGPAAQILQIPAVFVVNRTRRRKLMVVTTCFLGRTGLLLVALLPLLAPSPLRVPILVFLLASYFGLGAFAGCAWNSWMHDFIPKKILGSYLGRRLAIATIVGAVLSLAAGFYIDYSKTAHNAEMLALCSLFAIGGIAGLLGVFFQSRIPEPQMDQVDERGIMTVLAEPFRDVTFRPLLLFLGTWSFAINLAAPFFTVYLLKRIGLSMSWVIGLAVLSQVINVLFFRIWGRLADRFTNKSVLTVSGPLFVLSIALWPFTTMPDRYLLSIPLVIAIHALAGMSTAGVALCSGNIALKLAPQGKATAYLAVNTLVNGIAATAAPILAGILADSFSGKQLSLDLKWLSNSHEMVLPALNLSGLDFLFVFAVIGGLYAWHRLLAVKEQGEVEEGVVMNELVAEMRKAVKNVSTAAGLRHLTYFPYQKLARIVRNARVN